MTIELAIDPRTIARRNGPTTSHQAARRVSEFARQHHQQIVGVLGHHPEGLTVHEIAAMCRLDAHAVGKRMSELERDGQIEQARDLMGDVTRPSPSGRPARVWLRRQRGLSFIGLLIFAAVVAILAAVAVESIMSMRERQQERERRVEAVLMVPGGAA